MLRYGLEMNEANSLGVIVRDRRVDLDWTLDHASSRMGISRRLLVQIEAGESNPSLSTLLSVSDGLGVQLVDLLQPGASSVAHQRQSDNRTADVLWRTDSGSEARLLAAVGPVELWSWVLTPGEARRSEGHRHGSSETILVTEGEIEVVLGGADPISVDSNQSMVFAADVAHAYTNATTAVARFVMTVVDPFPQTAQLPGSR